MRIAYVAAGAAGMYCGSCLRDAALARELTRLGHEVALLPTYTPLRDEGEEAEAPPELFYGAVNVYLQQNLAAFRRTPRLLDRLLDARWLLGRLSRLAASTRPGDLGALTLSVLRGEDGHQAKELARLVAWLAAYRPDVVHLTNSLFLGLAAPVRRALAVPVVCSLQGEELFVALLEEPYRAEVRRELGRRAADADLFLATGRWYARSMAGYLGLAEERVRAVPLGVPLEGHGDRSAAAPSGAPFVVGYLARIAPEKGLHHLLEALAILSRALGPGRVRLHVAGYLGPAQRRYFAALRQQAEELGIAGAIEHCGELDRAGKLGFLSGLDAFAYPAVWPEAKGLPVLEALASGVAVVAPRHGSLTELVAETGGGILVEPGEPAALAAGLRALIEDPKLARTLGRRGREAVHARFGAAAAAAATVAEYQVLLARR